VILNNDFQTSKACVVFKVDLIFAGFMETIEGHLPLPFAVTSFFWPACPDPAEGANSTVTLVQGSASPQIATQMHR